MSYAKEELQKYVKMAEQNWYTIVEKTSTFLHFDTSMETKTYEIVVSLTEKLTGTYPEHKSCVMRCECESHINYYLKFEKDNEITRFSYDFKKDEDNLTFWDYRKESKMNIPYLTTIKQTFKEFVEEVPEYRLRILTGELKLEEYVSTRRTSYYNN